jgi:PAS domain S-box-containing protein
MTPATCPVPVLKMNNSVPESTGKKSDVTEPTPANDAARWNEERYRTLFDSGPVAVYSCDASGVIQEFNHRAVELWGCQPVPGDTDKRFCGSFKLFRPDGSFMPHEQCPMAEVVAGTLSEAHDAEVLIERPDGSRITVVVNIRPVKNGRGDVIGAINCFYDITSLKQTEEALRQSLDDVTRMQQLSTRLLQAGDFSLLLHDILDAAIEITGACMGHIQLLEGDLLRMTAQRGFDRPFLEFFDAVHGDLGACGTALQRGERVIVEDVVNSPIFVGTPALEVMVASGARAVQSTPLVSRSGRVLGMFSTHYQHAPQQPSERALRLLDILARQAADLIEHEQVEEARALLANIVNSSDDAIISKDLNGVITSWNAGAERIFGYAAAEVIGQSITIIIPAERRNEETEILRRLSQGQTIEHFETQRLTKDGRHVSISLTVSPVRNRHDVVIGASKIARDITNRVRADEERARLLASEQAARAQAEEASRAKDEFLATVSHELRTPLNAMLGWAAMLEQTASPDARTLKGLHSIHRNARTLAQLVDDLLDVSRMIGGKMRLDVVPMDFGDVIDAAVEAILPAANAKDIGIHVVVDPAGRAMAGDPTRLQQAVWNLLSNAVKFTPAGGRVDVSTRVVTGAIELAICDSGIGIDATFLPYVFDRFRQADASSTRAQSGLGLGLAIVRHLVELHGGTVRAESDGRDAGTRIVMQLPRRHSPLPERDAGKPVSAATATATTDVPRLDGVKVLIVDDDRESCEMMLEALRGYGAFLRCAMSASEAVDALSEFKPDLVLSDIAMPGRDGYAVLSQVRALETALGRRVPVAAVTAYAHAEDRERAIAAGFDEYVAKPVDPAALASAVAALAATANR